MSYSPFSVPNPNVWIHIEFGDPIPGSESGEYQFPSAVIRIPMNERAAVGRLMIRTDGSSSFEKF